MRGLLLGVALSVLVTASAAACNHIPPLGAGIDEMLKTADLSPADLAKVRDLHIQMKTQAARGDKSGARNSEEEVMKLFGYKKVWLRCGPGTFTWMKLERPRKETM